jgi:phage terminase large subunit-like protein
VPAASRALIELEELIAEYVADVAARPLRYLQWTPPQEEFYSSPARRKAFRAGNQLGKTYAGLRWVIDLAAGRHPGQFQAAPLECWIVCTSWSQSVAIMRKFHDLCDDDLIDTKASSNFSVRNGYGKDNPCVILLNGSVVRFRTTMQGAGAFQGSTIHVVLIDEPTDLDIYRELDRRLTRTGGLLGITFTPVNRDCRWLRELIEAGVISETHAKLTVENLTPVGATEPLRLHDGRLMDADWVAEQWKNTPAIYAPIVLDGMWEGCPVGQFFKNFARGRHVSRSQLTASRGPVRLCLGIDHATAARELGQVGILVQVQQFATSDGRVREAVMVLDEVVMSGSSSAQQFAREVCHMLRRRGVLWRDLYQAWGDNPAMSAHVIKSNAAVQFEIARQIGQTSETMHPWIRNAKEGRGAAGMLDAGCRYLYEALADDLLVLDPRCERLIDAFETWDFDRMHPAKDRIDALRYALRSFIFPAHTSRVAVRF